jgi:hypothetical protein
LYDGARVPMALVFVVCGLHAALAQHLLAPNRAP